MVLLQRGYLKVSRDPSDYPIHKAIFDGSLESIVELSYSDKATLTSLKLFGQEIDPFGNTPLKLAVRIGDYETVKVLLKSGCADANLKPCQIFPIQKPDSNSSTFELSAYELACYIGDEETIKHFEQSEHKQKRHDWKKKSKVLSSLLS